MDYECLYYLYLVWSSFDYNTLFYVLCFMYFCGVYYGPVGMK